MRFQMTFAASRGTSPSYTSTGRGLPSTVTCSPAASS